MSKSHTCNTCAHGTMQPRQNRWEEPTYRCTITLPPWLEKGAPLKEHRVVEAHDSCDLWKPEHD